MLTATRAGVECPRCGGQVLQIADERSCLQCGFVEAPVPLSFVEDIASELTARDFSDARAGRVFRRKGQQRQPTYRGQVL